MLCCDDAVFVFCWVSSCLRVRLYVELLSCLVVRLVCTVLSATMAEGDQVIWIIAVLLWIATHDCGALRPEICGNNGLTYTRDALLQLQSVLHRPVQCMVPLEQSGFTQCKVPDGKNLQGGLHHRPD